MDKKKQYDLKPGYCRKLGHHLTFEYCRKVSEGGLPCSKVVDCWFEHFAVVDFIREHYSPEQIDAFLTPPKDKISSLIDLINQAKKNTEPEP